LPGNAQDCAIGAFIGIHGQKRIKNNSDLGSHLTVPSSHKRDNNEAVVLLESGVPGVAARGGYCIQFKAATP
jgi:hypothetical protein